MFLIPAKLPLCIANSCTVLVLLVTAKLQHLPLHYLSERVEKKVGDHQMWVDEIDHVDRSRTICKVYAVAAPTEVTLLLYIRARAMNPCSLQQSSDMTQHYRDKPVALSCPPAGSGVQDSPAAYTRVANVPITHIL